MPFAHSARVIAIVVENMGQIVDGVVSRQFGEVHDDIGSILRIQIEPREVSVRVTVSAVPGELHRHFRGPLASRRLTSSQEAVS